jgi:cytochrome c peroxidase
MVKIKTSNRWSIKIIVVISICLFINISSGDNGDEALLNQAKQIFGPLPKALVSEKNTITPEKVKLGKILFYETRISVDGTVSCVRCHPIGLYAADGLKKSIGNNCKVNPRNAPTVFNAAGQISEHWVGNRQSVEDQAKQSVIGAASFGMSSYEAVEKILNDIKGYNTLFKEAFPTDKEPVNIDNFAKAIGAFERTLVTPSPFDDFLNANKDALTENQKQGLKIVMEVGCTTCHSGTFLGGQMNNKSGIVEPYWKYTKSETIDEGRYALTNQEPDKYVFKVPMLRNVEKTAPYFHDGSVSRLEEAIWIMGKVQLGKDLTKPQLEEINDFLRSLTGEIPEDAMKVPILPAIE